MTASASTRAGRFRCRPRACLSVPRSLSARAFTSCGARPCAAARRSQRHSERSPTWRVAKSSADRDASLTLRWREQDSNSRSRRERNGRWEARHISFRAQLYELGARQSRERPKSSNPSPPAGSPVRTWLFGAKPINSRRANRVATARPSRSLGARRGHRSLSVEPLARCTAAVPFSIQRAPSAAQPTRKLGARGASTCGSRVSP